VEGASGMLTYSLSGSEFDFEFYGKGLETETAYSLIHYADYEDRFNNSGGDNPGALIAEGTSDASGKIHLSDSVNLREDLTDDHGHSTRLNNLSIC